VFSPGERVLVTGPSGAGKSTLFRAITGIWPFGSGRVTVPKDAKVMLLPQRPYFPVAPLAAAVSYPAKAGTSTTPVLPRRSPRSACRNWRDGSARRRTGTACCRKASSSGWQSRARCCRRRITSSSTKRPRRSMKPPRPRSTACLQDRLKGTTIISIGHRSTLGAFHGRRVELVVEEPVSQVRDVPLASAAE
jgi:putative ATP-binding cassette transporter